MNAKIDFDKKRSGTGTKEWAEVTENICLGCPNDCLYCYAAVNANRFKKKARYNWRVEEYTKRAEMKSYPARNGVIMFPSTHDITPFNIDQYIRVAKLMLEKGNSLLIVTKPRLECIIKLTEELKGCKDQILFRFTIGTLQDHVSRFWEPNAPLPNERLECLAWAYQLGFQTSVSIEPMLEGMAGAIVVVGQVRSRVTDTIWIGKMNKTRLRVVMSSKEVEREVENIERMQSDDSILCLYNFLEDDAKVRWKDSIQAVVKKWREKCTR